MLLIDGDIYCYRVACACESDAQVSFNDGFRHAKRAFDSLLSDTLLAYPDHEYIVYITGGNNFRHDIAVTAPYKGNRKGEKPLLLQEVRDHAVGYWDAVVVEGDTIVRHYRAASDSIMPQPQTEVNLPAT